MRHLRRKARAYAASQMLASSRQTGPEPRPGRVSRIDIHGFHALAGKTHRVVGKARVHRWAEFEILKPVCTVPFCSGARDTIRSIHRSAITGILVGSGRGIDARFTEVLQTTQL